MSHGLGDDIVVCTALLLCDDLLYDSRKDKDHLIGVTNGIRPPRYPAEVAQLGIYARLTNATGSVGVSFILFDESNGIELFLAPLRVVRFDHRREVQRVFYRLHRAKFPHPGWYRLQCYANEQLVSEISICLL